MYRRKKYFYSETSVKSACRRHGRSKIPTEKIRSSGKLIEILPFGFVFTVQNGFAPGIRFFKVFFNVFSRF